jgi:hypothetical protein
MKFGDDLSMNLLVGEVALSVLEVEVLGELGGRHAEVDAVIRTLLLVAQSGVDRFWYQSLELLGAPSGLQAATAEEHREEDGEDSEDVIDHLFHVQRSMSSMTPP